jgi:hypothetical protein
VVPQSAVWISTWGEEINNRGIVLVSIIGVDCGQELELSNSIGITINLIKLRKVTPC